MLGGPATLNRLRHTLEALCDFRTAWTPKLPRVIAQDLQKKPKRPLCCILLVNRMKGLVLNRVGSLVLV